MRTKIKSSICTEVKDNIIRFPVEGCMPKHVAERKIGGLRRYRYPDSDVFNGTDIDLWIDQFLNGRSVLLGWSPVNEGLVSVFKKGNARHIISSVEFRGLDYRPLVELCCGGSDLYQVYNWSSDKALTTKRPVSLLSLDQYVFFKKCKHCEEYLKKVVRAKPSDKKKW